MSTRQMIKKILSRWRYWPPDETREKRDCIYILLVWVVLLTGI